MAGVASMILALVLVGVVPAPLQAAELHESAQASLNPIRKVVTLLQSMQTKVEEEGKKEEELYKKFMCYCNSNAGSLDASIGAAETKTTSLELEIKASEERKVGLESALKEAQASRGAAKDAMAEAAAIREKEATAFAAEKATSETNIAAIAKAVAALEKGMAGAFLQTSTAQVLRKLVLSQDMLDIDRHDLLSFLSGTQGSEYAPQSGEVTGILKQMGDEMAKGLAAATVAEEAAIKNYEEIMAAKTKEVEALTQSIEAKTQTIGELGVAIVQMKNDFTDTEKAAAADKEFIENLKKSCATKKSEWDEIVKTRAEELVALAETIKVLNDDDALEVFKKTLPSAASSFLQLQQGAASMRAHALVALKGALQSNHPDRTQLDLIGLALRGKKIGFEKVIGMIDTLVATLKKEQVDDESKKAYCAEQFDSADDKKKGLERSVSDEADTIAIAKDGIAAVNEEIAALEAGIKALDKSVAEATEQRKDEHEDFVAKMASDSAAKELLGFAKNRLNKFYSPKLYKPAPKVELSAEDRIFVSEGGTALTQVAAHVQRKDAPPPPPATFGAYSKKSEESSGVISMINLLITDLDKDMAEADTAEKDAQPEYEVLMKDSAAKRAADSASLSEKSSMKGALEGDLEAHKDAKASATSELSATLEYIGSLHAECDWLLQYFDVRKEARASEINALGNAKAVLNGADYSLLQKTSARGFLHRSSSKTCPSTSIYYTDSVDAAGTTIWSGPVDAFEPGKCYNVGAGGITAYKICGPGEFKLSRMTCDLHDYKAEAVSHPSTAFTVSTCKEYAAAGTYVDGHLGSFSFSCSATSR